VRLIGFIIEVRSGFESANGAVHPPHILLLRMATVVPASKGCLTVLET